MARGEQEPRNKDALKEPKREQVHNREVLITGQNQCETRDSTHGEKTMEREERGQEPKKLKRCKICRR